MTEQTLEQQLGVPDAHKLVKTGHESVMRHGRDKDVWSYNQVDENGNVVAEFTVTEDMNIYTQKTTFSFTRREVTS